MRGLAIVGTSCLLLKIDWNFATCQRAVPSTAVEARGSGTSLALLSCAIGPWAVKGGIVVNVLVGIFAILLCVINAAVWTFITGLPFMGAAWMLGAAACVKLQKWSWSPWSVRF